MKRSLVHIVLSAVLGLMISQVSYAQADRHDVRSGNRKFRKGDYVNADISYRRALAKDSTSFAAGYNLANNLFRQENMDEAASRLESLSQAASTSVYGAQYYYNKGDVAIAKEDWQGAVDALKESLLRNPGDIDAKENYIYAKKKLEEQQQNGGGGDNQDDQQDQNQDQNGGGDQNQDQQDQNQDQQNQDQNQDQQDQPQQGQQQPQEAKISPQQAQQMLQAIQAKEKETQDKVNKEKAEALKSRQKEKNW